MKDWHERAKKLNNGIDFLRLEAGSHKVKFLGDGEQRTVDYDGEKVNKIFIPVEHKGEKYTWTVTEGYTYNGLYGQIVLIGQEHGSIVDVEVTVLVKGSGKNKDYTITEAIELIEAMKKQEKEEKEAETKVTEEKVA